MSNFDATQLAVVADVLQSHHDEGNYDVAADRAHDLLVKFPALADAAKAYVTGPNTASAMTLRDAVAEAVEAV